MSNGMVTQITVHDPSTGYCCLGIKLGESNTAPWSQKIQRQNWMSVAPFLPACTDMLTMERNHLYLREQNFSAHKTNPVLAYPLPPRLLEDQIEWPLTCCGGHQGRLQSRQLYKTHGLIWTGKYRIHALQRFPHLGWPLVLQSGLVSVLSTLVWACNYNRVKKTLVHSLESGSNCLHQKFWQSLLLHRTIVVGLYRATAAFSLPLCWA